MRIEKDFLGEKKLSDDALYGIHALRAKENFPDQTPFHQEWYKAIGIVKLACYQTYKKFKEAVNYKYPSRKDELELFSDEDIQVLIKSAEEISKGKFYEHVIVPAIQGGAGTSINMNVNEIIANLSLQKLEE